MADREPTWPADATFVQPAIHGATPDRIAFYDRDGKALILFNLRDFDQAIARLGYTRQEITVTPPHPPGTRDR